jgi:hypothetical protein
MFKFFDIHFFDLRVKIEFYNHIDQQLDCKLLEYRNWKKDGKNILLIFFCMEACLDVNSTNNLWHTR